MQVLYSVFVEHKRRLVAPPNLEKENETPRETFCAEFETRIGFPDLNRP
jgi:hypothetical protein